MGVLRNMIIPQAVADASHQTLTRLSRQYFQPGTVSLNIIRMRIDNDTLQEQVGSYAIHHVRTVIHTRWTIRSHMAWEPNAHRGNLFHIVGTCGT